MKIVFIALSIIIVLITFFTGLTGVATLDPLKQTANERNFYYIMLIIGFLELFLLPIGYLIITNVIATKKSFERNPSGITFNQALNNLIPFRPIQVLINQVYPKENIINKKRIIYEKFAHISMYTISPLGYGFGTAISLPFLNTLYETEDSFYVDRRLAHILFGLVLILVLYYYVIFNNPVFNTPNNEIMSLFLYLFFGIFFVYTLIFTLFFQTGRILQLRKSWVSSTTKEGNKMTLVITIPKNSHLSLSTDRVFKSEGINVARKWTFYLS